RSGVDRFASRPHNLDGLGNGAGFEREIDRQAAVGAQVVTGLGRPLEPLTFDRDAVIADGQTGRHIETVLVGRYRARVVGVGVGNFDGRAGDSSSRGVRNGAGYSSGDCLR